MLLLRLVLGLILSASFSLAANENETTTASATTTTATFVTIGSNSKTNSSSDINVETTTTTANESISVKPIVHAVNAQARKIEMTKVLSAGDVTASLKSPTNGATGTGSFAISTTMIAIVAALILVVIVSVTVGTAMFVMRRRFSIWRLNNSKQNLNGAGDGGESSASSSAAGEEKSGVESSSTSAAASPGGVNANPDAVITTVDEENQLMTVENKGALVTPAVITENETKTESNDVVITDNTNGEKESEPATLTNGDQVQDVSSQSLIVNVLNELSESVANRLDAKSPSTKSIKSNSNCGDNETTTEPAATTTTTTTTTNEAVTDVPPVSQ